MHGNGGKDRPRISHYQMPCYPCKHGVVHLVMLVLPGTAVTTLLAVLVVRFGLSSRSANLQSRGIESCHPWMVAGIATPADAAVFAPGIVCADCEGSFRS
jgi:hypothetical protein